MSLSDTFAELERDLIHEDGPRISTMRNYRFCIVVYPPEKEFALRREVQRLGVNLEEAGWVVKTISLQQLLLDRLRRVEGGIEWLINHEKKIAARHPERGLNALEQKITHEIEGPDGIAKDVIREIHQFVAQNPDKAERTVVLIGRAGALYPFYRNSALLKHIDGHTKHVPVVLLYPGVRIGDTALSFMGQYKPDKDYRPRIYG
ncbi:MAG TPA: BREX protein BrxB domain-containing protein [Enhygromyxa sp.]|nr:BREX protein BrxB domain-containing protein [Enhygromyxa sp.]